MNEFINKTDLSDKEKDKFISIINGRIEYLCK